MVKKQTGFTLAEVLITLGIIGVVAAMTIPTLVQSYQKQKTIVGLKKAYTTISQTFENAQIEMGESTNWDTPAIEFDPAESAAWWNKYFIPYTNLSVTKTCSGSNLYQCWASGVKWLDGSNFISVTTSNCYCFVLNDGTVLCLQNVCNTYAQMYIDINGTKKPNIVGKDVFNILFAYPTRNVKFMGSGYPRTTLLTTGTGGCNKETEMYKGLYCGALIQQDGWKISDDYPWN